MPTTTYRLRDGTKVPSVTTCLNLLAKPALIGWANREGLAGRKLGVDTGWEATEGTQVHEQVMEDLRGPGIAGPWAYTPLGQFRQWRVAHRIAAASHIEEHLVSEDYRCGGTPDFVAEVDGVRTVVDVKTGKAVYPEHLWQAGTYLRLLQLSGVVVEHAMILHLPRDGGPWSEHPVRDPDRCFRVFLLCRELYDLTKELD